MIDLYNSKNLLSYRQLANLHKADNRPVRADFLFVPGVGQGQSINFSQFNGAVSPATNPVGLTLCRFASIAPHFKIANKTQGTMKTQTFLNPQLCGLYLESNVLAFGQPDANELTGVLTTLEKLFYGDPGLSRDALLCQMILLNCLEGHFYSAMQGADRQVIHARIRQLRLQISGRISIAENNNNNQAKTV